MTLIVTFWACQKETNPSSGSPTLAKGFKLTVVVPIARLEVTGVDPLIRTSKPFSRPQCQVRKQEQSLFDKSQRDAKEKLDAGARRPSYVSLFA